MKNQEIKKGLVVSVSVVIGMNPMKTKVETFFFEDIEEGREFAKNNITISKEIVQIVEKSPQKTTLLKKLFRSLKNFLTCT